MSSPNAPTAALEKTADRTPAVIMSADDFRGALLRWQASKYHVLTPFSHLSGLAPHHGILTSLVQLSPEKDDGDVYDNSGGLPFLKDGEVALAKPGLRKIAACAGISTSTQRTDPRTIQYLWEIAATITYRDLTGSIVTHSATCEWDLRDGSDRLKGYKSSSQITEARKNGYRNCETRAINAAIREYGLRQKYTKAELAKPFVVVRVMYLPDLSDPEIKRIVTERALAGTNAMYPALSAQAAAYVDVETVDAEERHDAADAGTAGQASIKPNARPAADAPPSQHAVRIVKIGQKNGTDENTGRPWTKFAITDSKGVAHFTIAKSILTVAEKFLADRAWVDIIDEQTDDGKFSNILEITLAQPSLPDPASL